ncbi:GntR family transcriptional regulator [Streptomyces sp. NPDC046821]|uniref:GntR family transcriptional regulator n=1 Tax=Streptomyces sp. NPDC046821 TaxID=3154702 RepID=UPI0033E2919F
MTHAPLTITPALLSTTDESPASASAPTEDIERAEYARAELRGESKELAHLTRNFKMDLNVRADREAIREFIEPRLPAAEERHRQASGSPTDDARWAKIIADMRRPDADVLSLSMAAQELLTALQEAWRPGPNVQDIANRIRASITTGTYPPGSYLSAGRLNTELGCEPALLVRVQRALTDLEGEGLITIPQQNRVRVAGETEQLDQVSQTTDWIRLLIQNGVYPPRTIIPTRRDLARLLVTPTTVLTQAMRVLHEEKTVIAYTGTPTRVCAELPFEAAEPPDLSTLLARLDAVALPDADLSPDNISAMRQQARNWWHKRFTPHPEALTHTFRSLAATTAYLIPLADQQYPDDQRVRTLLRTAAITALAELPKDFDRRVWRAACLGAAVVEILELVPDFVWRGKA